MLPTLPDFDGIKRKILHWTLNSEGFARKNKGVVVSWGDENIGFEMYS